MGYFVKVTTDGSSWGWCYATHLTPTPKVMRIHGAVAPLAGGGAIDLFGGVYPWAIGNGWLHAYPLHFAAPWFPEPATVVRFPAWIPDHVGRNGLNDAVEFALRGSRLREFYAEERVRRAVAEDLAIEAAAPFLRCPCFIPAGDDAFIDWAGARPAAYGYAIKEAERVVAAAGLGGEVAAIRRRLRVEAHRKVDVAREHFLSTPCLAHDPFWETATPHGVVRAGRPKSTSYPRGVGAPPIQEAAKDEAVIEAVENVLLPGSAPLDEKLSYVPWMQLFAQWEESSPFQALPSRFWGSEIPSGLLARTDFSESPFELSSLGLCPVISEPARQYVADLKLELPPADECARVCLERAWRVPIAA